MRVLAAALALALGAALTAGCSPAVSVSKTSSDNAAVGAVTESDGQVLSDQIAERLIAGDVDSLHEVMNSPFKQTTSVEAFDISLLFTLSGKPTEADYKWTQASTVMQQDGSQHPLRKYWYALKTERHEYGKYFLFVEVVTEDGNPVCNQFSIVSFADGVPDQLK